LPGSGLGLSLAAAVARLHHAELSIADNGPGTAVSIGFRRSL
jgi:signal transduction histidine kinase